MKKLGLSLLSLFAILFVGTTFANPIDVGWYDIPKVCYKLKNVEIDNYKVIIEYGKIDYKGWERSPWSPYDSVLSTPNERELYEAKKNECTKCGDYWWDSNVYLIDKNMDIKDITHENIGSEAIFIGKIYNSDCASRYDRIETYKLAKKGDTYEIVSRATKDLEKIRKFPLIWLFAVIIEAIALFLLVKSFQKKDEIKEEIGDESNKVSNKKLLLRGVIPTTVTLPFLRFVLPLILGDGGLYIVVGEILVATIEAVMIKYGLNISRKRAIIASIVCNICSFVVLLIYSLLDSYPYFMSGFVPAIITSSLAFIVAELIILFLVGKLSKEGVSNKKLVLCGLVTAIIDVVIMFFIVRLFEWYLDLDMPELLANVVAVIMKVSVDMLTIKWLRKISRGKAIIASIFFNLCLVAIILALIYFFG